MISRFPVKKNERQKLFDLKNRKLFRFWSFAPFREGLFAGSGGIFYEKNFFKNKKPVDKGKGRVYNPN